MGAHEAMETILDAERAEARCGCGDPPDGPTVIELDGPGTYLFCWVDGRLVAVKQTSRRT